MNINKETESLLESDNTDNDIREFTSYKKVFETEQKKIVEGINNRLEQEDFSVYIKNDDQNDLEANVKLKDDRVKAFTSLDNCKEAVKNIRGFFNRARSDSDVFNTLGIDWNYLRQLDEDCELLQLKYALAWSLDLDEMAVAISKTEDLCSRNEADGTIQILLEKAKARKVSRQSDDNIVSSVGEMTKILKNIVANIQINTDDQDISAIEAIISILYDAQNKINSYIKNDIQTVYDSRQDQYIEFAQFENMPENIRSDVRNALPIFVEKIENFKVDAPLTAIEYLRPVLGFISLLNQNEDRDTILDLRELEKEIIERCEKWNLASDKLNQAKTELDKPLDSDGYFKVFTWIREAYEIYPDHPDIILQALICAEKIFEEYKNNSISYRKVIKNSLESNKKEAIQLDWNNYSLQNIDLPEWLKKIDEKVNFDLSFAKNDLPELIKEELGESFYKKITVQLDDRIDSMLINQYNGNMIYVKKLIEIQKEIRQHIWNIQIEIDRGEVKAAQVLREQFLGIHEDLRNDPEIVESQKYINAHMDMPALVSRARQAFSNEIWVECLEICERIAEKDRNVDNIIALDAHIDAKWVRHYLTSLTNEIPPEGMNWFLQVMRQLAYLNRASSELIKLWMTKNYAAARQYLDEISKFGRGSSDQIIEIKKHCEYEEKEQEYESRQVFGDENLVGGVSFNQAVIDYLLKCKQHVETMGHDIGWLKKADDLLNVLINFDIDQQSLWCGQIFEQRKVLCVEFCKQLIVYIKSHIGLDDDDKEVFYEAQHFLETVKLANEIARIDFPLRRWVLIGYCKAQEQYFGRDGEKIMEVWRSAIQEFPDDPQIVTGYKKAQWTVWLWLLDDTLNSVARGRPDAKSQFDLLIQQKNEVAQYLFGDVNFPDNPERDARKFSLDTYHPEVILRKQSLQVMADADRRILEKPASLLIVLQDLRDRSSRKERQELTLKADTLAEINVIEELERGYDAVLANDEKAFVHFLNAYQLSPNHPDCIEQVIRHKRGISLYINDKINAAKDFDYHQGSVHGCLNDCQILIGIIESAIHFVKNNHDTQIDEDTLNNVWRDLKNKEAHIRRHLRSFMEFCPDSDLWIGGVNPVTRRMEHAQNFTILIKHIENLKNYFGDDHIQIKQLNTYVVDMKKFIEEIDQAKENLKTNYLDNDIIKNAIEKCYQISTNVEKLRRMEIEYLGLWKDWISDNNSFKVFYQDDENVYRGWRFKYHEIEYPFYSSIDWYKTWKETIRNYVNKEYQLNEDDWKSFLLNKMDIIRALDEQYAQNKDDLFLGGVLIVAKRSDDWWSLQGENFASKKQGYEKVYNSLSNDNDTRMKLDRLIILKESLEKWRMEIKETINNIQTITDRSRTIYEKINLSIKDGDIYEVVKPGDVVSLIEKTVVNIGQITELEESMLEKFKEKLDRFKRGFSDDENLPTRLKYFYTDAHLEDNICQKYCGNDADYTINYEDRKTFFEYIEGLK